MSKNLRPGDPCPQNSTTKVTLTVRCKTSDLGCQGQCQNQTARNQSFEYQMGRRGDQGPDYSPYDVVKCKGSCAASEIEVG